MPSQESVREKLRKRNVPVIKGTGPRKAPPKMDSSGKPPGANLPKSDPSSRNR